MNKSWYAEEKHKKKQTTHGTLFFSNSEIKLSSNQKHLGLALDRNLSFNEHINDNVNHTNKGVDLLRKMQTILLRTSLMTIYKWFIRPLFDYADVIYDKPSNALFSKKK